MKIKITPTLIALTALTLVSFASARLASPNPHLATLDGPLLYTLLTFLHLAISSLIGRGTNLRRSLGQAESLAGDSKSTDNQSKPLRPSKFPLPDRIVTITTITVTLALLANLAYTTLYKPQPFLPWGTSIAIALKTVQSSSTHAILGFGPNNFTEAFTALKPLSFNQSPLWYLRFAASRNQPLHILTTTGLLGLLIYLAIIILGIFPLRKFSSPILHTTYYILLATSVALQFLLPPSAITFALFVVLVSLTSPTSLITLTLPRWSPTLILVPALIIAIFWFDQVYSPNKTFNQSIAAIKNNQGTEAYNLQIKAIHKNRYHDGYRSVYATTNLALASAFSTKKDLTGGDREKIATLIQQAIREAKIATTLNPYKTSNWEALANIYHNLIGTVENAHTWAIASYEKAHTTDPQNPTHLLSIGSIYLGQKEYDQALNYYDQAVLLKPNWANAHYHRALALKAKGNTQAAAQAMQTVLKYLPETSPDYPKAQDELTHINEPFESSPSSDLQTPAPTPTPNPAGKITLPPDLTPTN